jgi:hypothetical protein
MPMLVLPAFDDDGGLQRQNSADDGVSQNERLVHERTTPDTLKAQLFWNMRILTSQRIRLDSDHKSVPALTRKLQKTDMTRVKHVESA